MSVRCAVRWKANDSRTRCILEPDHHIRGQLSHIGDYFVGGVSYRQAWVNLYDPEYVLRRLAALTEGGA